ncbi:predicted protein [Histoplasma capsulatum var. duboisii H88]|uniref:Predicted protein n=1 Tax=Ajellomyces capsulatus (strain H88) TaxID=544711 RepID=F0UQB2_AJEC8|nr:predicted protein [Histoplasma capsulatum var. duboisii H88]
MAQIEEMEKPPTKRFEFAFRMLEGVSVECCRCIIVNCSPVSAELATHSNCKKQWHMVSSFSQRWLSMLPRTRLDISGLEGCEVHVENQTRSSRASKGYGRSTRFERPGIRLDLEEGSEDMGGVREGLGRSIRSGRKFQPEPCSRDISQSNRMHVDTERSIADGVKCQRADGRRVHAVEKSFGRRSKAPRDAQSVGEMQKCQRPEAESSRYFLCKYSECAGAMIIIMTIHLYLVMLGLRRVKLFDQVDRN